VLQAPQDRDKNQFIMGLEPFFKGGDIILVGGRAAHPQLVGQILNFPSGKKDVLNALAYITRVFAGIAVYPDFGEHNQISGYVPPRNAPLLLGVNATSSETCAVLCCIDGSYLTVLADWVSPLMPNDAIPDIAKLIRAVYPGKKVTTWVPADVFDQVGRNPVITSLRSAGLRANRGENAVMCRNSLSPMIRTEMRGRRLFQVDSNANNTMQAMASGYNFQIKPGGERMGEPERNSARCLMEALECLTFAMNKEDTAALLPTNASNTHGTPYLSALPR
jgi:hypothetical protein